MDKRQLLERYEALGNEHDFLAAKPLFERALAERPDADLLLQYGYLLECHGRNELASRPRPTIYGNIASLPAPTCSPTATRRRPRSSRRGSPSQPTTRS